MAEDEYKKIFAKNLKHYMTSQGKNQMDLMRDLGLSSSTVSNWCTIACRLFSYYEIRLARRKICQ